MAHGDLAYSNQALPAHTDTTYFTDPAGLQIFHLLSHEGAGGSSLLVDGFFAASQLSPSAYVTLSRLGVPSHASGSPGTILRPMSRPSLIHDDQGHLVQVRWNNEDRGVIGPGWTAEDVESWYAAARELEQVNRSPAAEYWKQLEPGTMVGKIIPPIPQLTLVIDNWRVMHGRSAFTGSRRMCGAYIGADDWRSRRAALRTNLEGVNDSIWDFGW
jgi:trimethyllysine dioxygenase